MAELTDDDLLARLEVALASPPIRPDEQSITRLYATLAELELEDEPVNITSTVHHRTAAPRSVHERRRRFPKRSSVLVASAISFALTAGVAAAAVVTNTLPGPTRGIAYDLGLPVTSPGLFRAQQDENQLRQSIAVGDQAQEKQLGQKLISAMKTLDSSDLSQIRSTADKLLIEVGLGAPTLSNSTTTPNSTTTVPSTTPSAKISGVTVPPVTVPTVTTPTATVLPPVTTPTVTTPT
ncbi:MAG: hypothetical protein WBD82_06025, partial [Acidimicrobiales bacterium]